MRRVLAFFLLGLLLPGLAAAETRPRDPYQNFFSDTFFDLKEELTSAREKGKKAVLLFFEMDECPFCHRMKTTVLNQPDVQAYFSKHFVAFPIDTEGDIEMHDFAGRPVVMKDFAFKQYRVRATPVIAFFDLDGNYIKRARFTGATRDKDEFLLLGKYVVENAYEQSSFSRYKRTQEK